MSFQFKIIDNKSYILDISKNNLQPSSINKLFHDDYIDDEGKLISSEIRNRNLVGVFSTVQTQKFGKNKKGNDIFLVKPLLKNLPGFMIAYGGKLKGKIVIKFKFTSWEKSLPSGQIIDVIGQFKEENLVPILMNHYNLSSKKINYNGHNLEKNLTRKEYNSAPIFSIDPEDCVDIDDALSIEIKNGITIIGVHIAQPICYLSLDDIKSKAKIQFSTLYTEDKRFDLWGEKITNDSSLFEGEKKNAYSTMFYFEDNKIIKIEDYPAIITNSKKLSYENAHTHDEAIKLKNFTNNIFPRNEEIPDFHELISFWMIKTNNYIAEKYKDIVPFRVNNENILENSSFPEEIKTIIKNKFIEAASYSYDEIRHDTLKLNYYCHFTSPIRRLVDTWIHFLITYKCFSEKLNLEETNKLDKDTKKFHRQIELNRLINNLFQENRIIEKTGYITEILSNNLIEVYLETLGFLKVKLYNLIFDYKIEKRIEDGCLTLKYENVDYVYKIGSMIELSINKIEGILPKDKIIVIPKNVISFI